jgi:hypothetical protein
VLSPKRFTAPTIGFENRLPGSLVILSTRLFETLEIPVGEVGRNGTESPEGMCEKSKSNAMILLIHRM